VEDAGEATVVHLRNRIQPPSWLAENVDTEVLLRVYIEQTAAFALANIKTILEALQEGNVAQAIRDAAVVVPEPASDQRVAEREATGVELPQAAFHASGAVRHGGSRHARRTRQGPEPARTRVVGPLRLLVRDLLTVPSLSDPGYRPRGAGRTCSEVPRPILAPQSLSGRNSVRLVGVGYRSLDVEVPGGRGRQRRARLM
jgi:hypothetical protein